MIAADSGLEQAGALGLVADVVVGDLDSVDPAVLDAARDGGVDVEVHPVDKDRTDLELALRAARDRGATEIVVVGGDGGRHDHLLANLLLLAHADLADVRIVAHLGRALVSVVRGPTELFGERGDLVSLLAVAGPARGVYTAGLRFPLRGEDLEAGSTRGVSNELADPVACVAVDRGVLLAVQPFATDHLDSWKER
ncbi:MAG: thiamine diphosphokinase [Acidimicrobiia bacterium]|nr:thiamine diphosphokinase [Acidimicrobiia bacterium]